MMMMRMRMRGDDDKDGGGKQRGDEVTREADGTHNGINPRKGVASRATVPAVEGASAAQAAPGAQEGALTGVRGPAEAGMGIPGRDCNRAAADEHGVMRRDGEGDVPMKVEDHGNDRQAGDEPCQADQSRQDKMQQSKGEGANASGFVMSTAGVRQAAGGAKAGGGSAMHASLPDREATTGVASEEGGTQLASRKRRRSELGGEGVCERLEGDGEGTGRDGELQVGEGVASGADRLPGPHSAGLCEEEREELSTTFPDLASAMDSWDHLWCRRCLVSGFVHGR